VLADGDQVVIHGDSSSGLSRARIDAFYSALPGVGCRTVNGTITETTFSGGVDLFIVMLPSRNYAVSELATMKSFVDQGGSIWFMGEWFGGLTHDRINLASPASDVV
jgi:hypothetical protein